MCLAWLPFSQIPWQGPQGLVLANEVHTEGFWEIFCFLPKKEKEPGEATFSLLPALDTEAKCGAVAVIMESLGQCQWSKVWKGLGPSEHQAAAPDLILLPEKQLTV